MTPREPPTMPGFRATWFLFKQPWMLGPAAVATLAWVGFVCFAPMKNGHASAGDYATLLALGPMLGFGVAALTGLPGFMLYRLLATRKPAWERAPGEETLFEVRANHLLGDEGRGGRLLLTDRRLVFVPHRFNVQLATWEARLDDIAGVGWSEVKNARGMTLTTLLHVETARATELFPVARAELVAELIDAMRAIAPGARPTAARDERARLAL